MRARLAFWLVILAPIILAACQNSWQQGWN
jgi:predicted small secreted protein